MTPAGAPPAEYAPIFDWGARPRRKISFLTFLAASIVLHALCFYLFQITYPLTVALLPPPARVSLITPDSEQGRLLLRWLEAEDPALSSLTQRPPGAESSLPPVPAHRPSYAHHQPALKQLPPYRPDLRIPSALPPGPVALPRPSPPVPAAPVSSSLRFAPSADSLGPPQIPALHFATTRNAPPEAAQFRVGIDPLGAVRYSFIEKSSGDPALDEQARRQLMLCRFPKIGSPPAPLLWTTASFQWGNDLARPATSSEPSAP